MVHNSFFYIRKGKNEVNQTPKYIYIEAFYKFFFIYFSHIHKKLKQFNWIYIFIKNYYYLEI